MKFMERENLESYTETQYNNFGWVRYNNVLSATEYNTLLSRYADYKYNKDNTQQQGLEKLLYILLTILIYLCMLREQ